MRAVIAILLIAVIGFLAYSYFTSLSQEEKSVKALDKEFDQAVSDFLRALRTTAGTGLDTTPDVNDAVRKIKKVKSKLKALMGTLQEDSAKETGKKLEEMIKEFERKNDIEKY